MEKKSTTASFFNSLFRKLNFLIPTVGVAPPLPPPFTHVISYVKLRGRGMRTR